MKPILPLALEQPNLFFYLIFTLLCLFAVSLARLAEATGPRSFSLAARQALPKFIVTGLLLVLWLGLTYDTFLVSYTLAALTLLGGALKALFFLAVLLVVYVMLSFLFYRWLQGGAVAAGAMAVLIVVIFSYTLVYKPAWICKPMALSGISSSFMCLARAYEFPGNQGVRIDIEKMLYWYEEAAVAGNAEAAYLLALRTSSQDKSRRLFEQAASAGHAKAALQLSRLSDDKNESLKWLRIAAKEGVSDAIYDLGMRYRDGSGVDKNLNKTREMWFEAAQSGSLLAMLQLATSYQQDSVVFDKDTDKYNYWKNMALAEKERRAASQIKHPASMQENPYDDYVSIRFQSSLDYMEREALDLRSGSENDPDKLKKLAEQYLRYQEGDGELRSKAISIYTKLAVSGDVKVQFDLAELLLNSQATEDDIVEGRRWLSAAANANYEPAVRSIINAYKKGEHGFQKDSIKLLYYSERLRTLIEQRPNGSRNRAAKMFAYFESENIKADIEQEERLKIIQMLRKPAEDGDANAQYRLAHLLMIEKNRTESLGWLEKAAKNGNADAQYLVSKRIVHMKPRDKNSMLSFHYLQNAAEQNHPGAMMALAAWYQGGFRRIGLKKNLYKAYFLYQKALASTNDDVIFANRFGNPEITSPITRHYVVSKLNEIPGSFKRLHIEGLSNAQLHDYINNWYYEEVENVNSQADPEAYLQLINEQREVLLNANQ